MAKRIIAALSAAHTDADKVGQEAKQGDEVDLTPDEEKRLEAQGALVPHGFSSFEEFSDYKIDAYRGARGDQEAAQRMAARGRPASAVGAEITSGGIADLGAPQDAGGLAAYIGENRPTVDETVALAQGNADKARIVLEAERTATGGEPRKGVEEALGRIIESGETE